MNQMEPIYHLKRGGISGTSREGKSFRSIPRQYLHTGMLSLPLGERLGLFAFQDVRRLMVFQVHQDSPMGAASPQGKFVHSQSLGRRHWELFLLLQSNQTVCTGYVAQEFTNPGRRFDVTGMS
jgi:hypothetical protein